MTRWLKQQKLRKDADSEGDCLPTCLAALLNIPREDVPPLNMMMVKNSDNWNNVYREFMNSYGYDIIEIAGNNALPIKGYSLVRGANTGGFHFVIYKDGKLFHDPAGANGLIEITHTYVFSAIDPAVYSE